MTWHEVLAIHGSRRGIRVDENHASVLLDFGLSSYHNRREDNILYYEGEGKTGHQTPTRGNAGLLECLADKRPVLVLERQKPGVWQNAGEHLIIEVEYIKLEVLERYVFVFAMEKQAL